MAPPAAGTSASAATGGGDEDDKPGGSHFSLSPSLCKLRSLLARSRRENHNLIAKNGVKAATDFYSKAGELIAPLQETDYVSLLSLNSFFKSFLILNFI